MPLPLGGTVRNVTLKTVGLAPRVVAVSLAHSWTGKACGGPFPATARAVAVHPVACRVTSLTLVRRWNGLGGVVYLPSFPQLARHQTSFPSAL